MKRPPKSPPKIAEIIVNRLLPDRRWHTFAGDFEEYFREVAGEKNLFAAHLWYWSQVFSILFRRIGSALYWRTIMFGNYFKSAFRNMKRHKMYSFINISGLAVGMAAFILIALYIYSELNIDRFNKNYDRIYRIAFDNYKQPAFASAVGYEIAQNVPDVEKIVRFYNRSDYLARYRPDSGTEKSTVIKKFTFADTTVFNVFSFRFIFGNPVGALDRPRTFVLTKSVSQVLFGEQNPIGKSVQINNDRDYTVTGVIEDPVNSHLDFDVIASFGSLSEYRRNNYDSWNMPTYGMLHENHDKKAVAEKVTQHFERLFREKLKVEETINFWLYDLKDVYFHGFNQTKQGSMQVIYMFAAVSLLIILLAGINFINLTTARAGVRAREIGVKKVVGSTKRQLIGQFLWESVFFSIISFILACILAYMFMPLYRDLIGREIDTGLLFNPWAVVAALIFVPGIGILAGLYPSFYIADFSPVTILRGTLTRGRQAAAFRKAMILFQFTISIILLIGTLTVYRQLNYVRNADLGFNREQTLNFHFSRNPGIRNHMYEFREALLRNPQVTNVSFSQGYPGFIYNWEGFEYKEKSAGMAVFTVDPWYFDLFGFEFVDGRPYDEGRETDKYRTCILNEAAVRELELEEPVGVVFHRDSSMFRGSSFPVLEIEVIGVVKDFHFQSLHDDIRPLIFSWNPEWLWNANVRIAAGNVRETLRYIEETWKSFSPDFPLEYRFLDNSFNEQYRADEQFGRIFGYFAGLAVFIACMGLFGMASYLAERRTKEIGIRKVLGASATGTVLLLLKDFVRWVVIANVFAWPVAWFVCDLWLRDFAYRAEISPFVFIFAGAGALVMAVLSVSIRTLRTAMINPVNALRYE